MGATAVPLYALQRLTGGRWAVHAPDDDPYSPAVRTIAVVAAAHVEQANNKQMAIGSHPATFRAEGPRGLGTLLD